jgi:hypothetical protein
LGERSVAMNSVLRTPNAEIVRAACEEFERDNQTVEQALRELFNQYRGNEDLRHVLLKVVTLNALYSAGVPVYSRKIPDVEDVARHIQRNAQSIDSALAAGSPEIVDCIARVTVTEKKDRIYFSFATKYCSWHNPASYPIYDYRVSKYICSLQKQAPFADQKLFAVDRWDYPTFLRVMTAFRDSYRLGPFTFKEIDKFLWSEGGTPD